MHMNVCFTPQDYIRCNFFEDHATVVIDVLRATTSIITALVNGCREFVPVATVEEALNKKSLMPDALLGGERQGVKIPGFDLGNSPFDYKHSLVQGKVIITTTTNGTVALTTAEAAARVYLGAFVNAAALCRKLTDEGKDCVLLCSGNNGRFSLEDTLCAGLIADRMSGQMRLGDAAQAALAMYREYSRNDLVKQVSESSHAAFLIKAGFQADIAYCLQPDIHQLVPEFSNGVIIV